MFPEDIRQSDKWLEYLEFLGWKKIETSNGVKAAMMQSKLGNVIKIQRPKRVIQKDLEELEDAAQKNDIALIKLEPNLNQDLQVLKDFGYEARGSPLSPPSTLFIDLRKSEKELWEEVSGSGKYSIRRARREGAKVEFHVNPSEDLVKKFYQIHSSTGKQKSFYIQPYEDIKKKVDLFGNKAVLGMVSTKDGSVTGANLYLGYEEAIWYIHGGTTSEGRKTKNGYELYWQSILFLKEGGYDWLDLEGVDDKRFPGFTKGWGGLSHFKEKFGGTRIEFPSPYVKFYKPLIAKISRYFNVPV